MLLLQAFVSIFIQGALVGVVYVKITKPFTFKASHVFSKSAVVRFVFVCYQKIFARNNFGLGDKFLMLLHLMLGLPLFYLYMENTGLNYTRYPSRPTHRTGMRHRLTAWFMLYGRAIW